MGIPNMHIPTSSTLSRGVWRQTCHPLSFHPWLQPLSAPSDYTTGLYEPYVMYCYMEADMCVVRESWGWFTSTWGTPPTTAPPLSHSTNCIWESECVDPLALQYRQVILSLHPPTCVWEGCWVHFPWAVCMHALDHSQYTWPSVHNTILGTSWHSTN